MSTSNVLDQFETRLLDELRGLVAERSATGKVPTPLRSRRRVTLLAAAAAALAALGMAGGVVLTRPTPAGALERLPDGTIIVKVTAFEHAPALERALRAEGVDAAVEFGGSATGSIAMDSSGHVTSSGGPTGPEHPAPTPSPEQQGAIDEMLSSDPCAFGDPQAPPVSLTQAGAEVQLRLEARWVAARQALRVTTISASPASPAAVVVSYDVPETRCGIMVSLGR